MKKILIVLFITLVAGGAHGLADTPAGGAGWDESVRFEDDSAPIINCKTAEQDIAALEKQITDIKTKLLEEVEGIVPTSAPQEAGIIDPTKDIQAGEATEQELQAKIANIKQVCGLG